MGNAGGREETDTKIHGRPADSPPNGAAKNPKKKKCS